MNELDTADAPREWIRFSNEPAFDPETYWAPDPAAQAEADSQARMTRMATVTLGIAAAAFSLLAIVSCAGYSLGPGSGQTVMCEAAGGHMIDRAIVHRCAP